MRGPAPDSGEILWAQHEPYFDASGLAEILGTTVDAVNQAIAEGRFATSRPPKTKP